ncbi:MAG: tetratricopeptide repeat protein [Caulobacteraceae bacterium]|nr:tetratricopeptide repeat protein [Caulobacteraceae bacterium]
MTSRESLLERAAEALAAGRDAEAAETAARALALDAACGSAWRITGLCRERAGDLDEARLAYQQALALSPEEPSAALDLARVMLKLDLPQLAEALLAKYLELRPGAPEAVNNLALAQRDQLKFGAAIETLRGGLGQHPENPMLWNSLGVVLTMRGDAAGAQVFYDEALRLAPGFANARFNRAQARLSMGETAGVAEEIERAAQGARTAQEAAGMRVALAQALLRAGELPRGWAAWAARRDLAYESAVDFQVAAPAWRDDLGASDLAGKRLLLIGEQGLGDEVLFAQMLADLQAALGSEGKLVLAVEPRLVELFRRSFPKAEVGAHESLRVGRQNTRRAPFLAGREAEIDLWGMLGEPLALLRPTRESFAGTGAYLQPDPRRVAHWRARLADIGPGPKVGVIWKSLLMTAARQRFYAPFADWAPVLCTPGVRFVNLQCGESAAEAAIAARDFGADLWTPPGLDLKDDLDDLAALCRALDLVIGPSTAATNIAGAVGAPLWLISAPEAWTRLGGGADYPWYPGARMFAPAGLDRWGEVMAEIAEALEVRPV